MAEAELRDSTERDFEDYGKPLEMVETLKYLGRVMTTGRRWPETWLNQRRAGDGCHVF